MVGMKTSLNLISSSDSLTVVEKKIDEVTKEANVNEDLYGNVLIAVTEGVNNAIHHGNKSNPEKNVEINIEINSENELVFMIKDEGDGFEPDALPDPTDLSGMFFSTTLTRRKYQQHLAGHRHHQDCHADQHHHCLTLKLMRSI